MKKTNRKITKVFLHCSTSDSPAHDNIKTITEWHLERGFKTIGYHYVITKDGTIHEGRDINIIPAAQKGYNNGSIAICLTGEQIFSKAQLSSLQNLCKEIKLTYPAVTFHGHCEVSTKRCPVFDYRSVLGLDAEGNMQEQAQNTTSSKIIKLVKSIIDILSN